MLIMKTKYRYISIVILAILIALILSSRIVWYLRPITGNFFEGGALIPLQEKNQRNELERYTQYFSAESSASTVLVLPAGIFGIIHDDQPHLDVDVLFSKSFIKIFITDKAMGLTRLANELMRDGSDQLLANLKKNNISRLLIRKRVRRNTGRTLYDYDAMKAIVIDRSLDVSKDVLNSIRKPQQKHPGIVTLVYEDRDVVLFELSNVVPRKFIVYPVYENMQEILAQGNTSIGNYIVKGFFALAPLLPTMPAYSQELPGNACVGHVKVVSDWKFTPFLVADINGQRESASILHPVREGDLAAWIVACSEEPLRLDFYNLNSAVLDLATLIKVIGLGILVLIPVVIFRRRPAEHPIS